jgi:hypothetical protein
MIRVFRSIQWDIYTVIIVALVPVLLLSAWGLTEWDRRQLHTQQCIVAREWLQEAESLAPMFGNATTMDGIAGWIAAMEEINVPSRGSQLRRGILSSANYHMEHFPNTRTTSAGVLNPPNGLFAREIDKGRQSLIAHCPETEALLPAAFPMVFAREEPN